MNARRLLAVLGAVIAAIVSSPDPAQSQIAVFVDSCPATRTTPYPLGVNPVPLTVDKNGNLCDSSSGGGGGGSVTQGTVPWVDSITLWGGGTLGAMANYGTSPGAVLVPGVNAFVTNFPATYAVTGAFFQATQPVSVASLPPALGGTTSANSFPVVLSSDGPFATQTGSITETAPATDTASSGLNGRLQRIAQRITSLITALGSPFQAGGSIGNTSFGLNAQATGGATVSSAIAPATPAGVNLKASAGTLYGLQATTIQASPVYVKLYNSASAPTCGSGTPIARFMVPAAATAANGGGTNIQFPVGIAFGTGIGYCVTGALADNDTTAITAANTLVNIEWN